MALAERFSVVRAYTESTRSASADTTARRIGASRITFIQQNDGTTPRRRGWLLPRVTWKDFLRLSLVSCPIALSLAARRTKTMRFNRVWGAGTRVRDEPSPTRPVDDAEPDDEPPVSRSPRITEAARAGGTRRCRLRDAMKVSIAGRRLSLNQIRTRQTETATITPQSGGDVPRLPTVMNRGAEVISATLTLRPSC